MRSKLSVLVSSLALLAFLLVSGSGASAQTGAAVPLAAPPGAPRLPAVPPPALSAQAVVLYDQTDNPGTSGVVSQEFADFPTFSSQAADDFFVPQGTSGNWSIETVTIVGTAGVPGTQVRLQVFPDSNGKPGGSAVYNQVLAPANVVTATFDLNLSPVLALTTGTYWLSAQVIRDFGLGQQWFWNERALQNSGPSHWQNPGSGYGTGCTIWQARVSVCNFPADSTSPDVMFRLSGTSTIVDAGPITYYLDPATKAAGSADFVLKVNGTNFNASSQVLWNGAVRSTTLNSANQVQITVPASDMALPAPVTIKVRNTVGLKESNSQTFTISGGAVYLPILFRQ